MAYSEKLANRIREALSNLTDVEEKKMMRGLVFMVNGKMCVNAVEDELMCRIDPGIQESLQAKKGWRAMEMKGKPIKGYVLVNADAIKTKKDFDYWINLCLSFNDKAKASKKRMGPAPKKQK